MESLIRLMVALGIFIIMVTLEYFKPFRTITSEHRQRWLINLGLAVFNMLVMRLTIGGLAYFAAVYAQTWGYGLLNAVSVARWLQLVLGVLFLDFAIYCQHIISHRWSLLWRFHKVHHSDMEFDATTALRFHPLEIVFSMLYKVLWVFVIGADPLAVVIFEILLNGAAIFNHSNVTLPPKLDHKLRYLIITPDMHRIHHSVLTEELNSNYGFSISVWDRIFKTYKANTQNPQATMAIGLSQFRRIQDLGFLQLLRLPFI